MRTLVFVVLLIGNCLAESSNSESNKITSSKTTLVQVPSGQSGKYNSPPVYQQQQPQYVTRTPMYIIAQPVASPSPAQFAPNNAQFQQAVQQLLHYYESNPQAKLQLLQQQQGGYFALAPSQAGPSHGPPSNGPSSHASPSHSLPAFVHPQQAYIVPQHQAYVLPQHLVSQHVVPQHVVPQHVAPQHIVQAGPHVPVAQPQYQFVQSQAQSHRDSSLEGMKIVPAPHLDRQPQSNHHYVPASTSSSSQHYIPAVANGQFSFAPPSYHTIPQHYYNQPPHSPAPVQTQAPVIKSSESRNDLQTVDKYQQSPATLVRSYYYKG